MLNACNLECGLVVTATFGISAEAKGWPTFHFLRRRLALTRLCSYPILASFFFALISYILNFQVR